jgi:hypothetical protein
LHIGALYTTTANLYKEKSSKITVFALFESRKLKNMGFVKIIANNFFCYQLPQLALDWLQ